MSARKFPSFVNPNPSNSRSSRGRIPASGFEGRQHAAHAKNGRFQFLPTLRLAGLLMKIKRRAREEETWGSSSQPLKVNENTGG